jgi:hypothetical protein
MAERVRPSDERPRTAVNFVRPRMTGRNRRPTVIGMSGADWPWEQFNRELDQLMEAAHIQNRKELATLVGMNTGVPYTWQPSKRRPRPSQPTSESLAQIAPILETTLDTLQRAAGRPTGGTSEAAEVWPVEVRELRDLWRDERMTADDRVALMDDVSGLVAGWRTKLDRRAERGSSRRQSRIG